MGSGREHRWSVFDGVKFRHGTPEALMAEINTALVALEYAHATELLNPSSSSTSGNRSSDATKSSTYDARVAEEAYKLGCDALAEGKVDEALQSLIISLRKCPPEKIDAVAKIQSLISFTSQRFPKSSK